MITDAMIGYRLKCLELAIRTIEMDKDPTIAGKGNTENRVEGVYKKYLELIGDDEKETIETK